jgi:hypothetical protein
VKRRPAGLSKAGEPGVEPNPASPRRSEELPDRNVSFDGGPVGFGKPPVSGQFKKGETRPARSGRKRGIRNHATIMREILQETIEITERGRKRRVTKFEAAMRQAMALALNSGSLDAIIKLHRLVKPYLVEEEDNRLLQVESIPGDEGL